MCRQANHDPELPICQGDHRGDQLRREPQPFQDLCLVGHGILEVELLAKKCMPPRLRLRLELRYPVWDPKELSAAKQADQTQHAQVTEQHCIDQGLRKPVTLPLRKDRLRLQVWRWGILPKPRG